MEKFIKMIGNEINLAKYDRKKRKKMYVGKMGIEAECVMDAFNEYNVVPFFIVIDPDDRNRILIYVK